ncbi:hypothetical protein LEMLEM_LOCUS11993 [Lemmus lemmus]
MPCAKFNALSTEPHLILQVALRVELEMVPPTSCYSSSCLCSLLHPETSTRSVGCICSVWSLRADSWGAPCVKTHLTKDGESTQGS